MSSIYSQVEVFVLIFGRALSAYFIADFVSGVLHWIEDTYNVHSLFVCANRYHHIKPHAMTRHGLWFTIDTSVYLTLPLAFLNYLLSGSVFMYEFLFFVSFANQIHKWSHTRMSEVPKMVFIMQATGLFISQQHHHKHHQDNTTCYCAMTNYLNPVLDYFRFWRGLEYAINKLTGIEPRAQTDQEVVERCFARGYLLEQEQSSQYKKNVCHNN